MRVLVTGGAGYVGSITTRTLLDAGHECVVLDTLEKGFEAAVDSRARLVVGSVGDSIALDDALAGVDAVMHLAGYIEVAESIAEPQKYRNNNFEAPQLMLDMMVERGIEALVFSSTAAVYGEPERIPVTEDARTLPINPYGESKLLFEQELDRRAASGLRSIRFRYFNVAGAWPDGSMGEAHDPETHIVPRVLKGVLEDRAAFEIYGSDYPTADGTCVRDYVHVCDLARAHMLALERLHAGGSGGVYNLGNGDGFSNLELVHACEAVTRTKLETVFGPRRPGDPAVLVSSAEKVARELGWQPHYTDLREIVGHAWSWHLAHPNGYR